MAVERDKKDEAKKESKITVAGRIVILKYQEIQSKNKNN